MLSSINTIVRPIITLGLTAVFCIIVLGAGFGLVKEWKDILEKLCSVLVPLITFWFGERAALKIPGKEEGTNDKPEA